MNDVEFLTQELKTKFSDLNECMIIINYFANKQPKTEAEHVKIQVEIQDKLNTIHKIVPNIQEYTYTLQRELNKLSLLS